MLLPFFNGERTPELPHARGALSRHGPAQHSRAAMLYRAAMEGATYTLQLRLRRLPRAPAWHSIASCLTGGGSHSAAWRQMVADVFDLPVEVPRAAEGAAFGAALQALWSLRAREGRTASRCPNSVDAHVAQSTPALALHAGSPSRVPGIPRALPSASCDHLAAVTAIYARMTTLIHCIR